MTRDEIAIVRRAYAKQVLGAAGVADPRVETAFAETEREHYLGPGPWSILRPQGYALTPTADPVYLYTDDLVAIDPSRGLNNGQPSFHALLMAQTAPVPGQRIVHVGTGTGYYTAILGSLAGLDGRVTGIEHDAGLAETARANLRGLLNVTAIAGDGATTEFDPADVIYVNAGAARPANLWLDRLKDGGRLMLPLTMSRQNGSTGGACFLVTRRGSAFLARRISATRIFPCVGLRDAEDERALGEAFAQGDGGRVTHLHRRDDLPEEICWLRGRGWCLTTE